MDSVKWLERIVVAKAPPPPQSGTYLESKRGPTGEIVQKSLPRIQVKSVIIAPAEGAVLRRGRVEIRGLAWSGTGRVSSVQVSVDGGSTWQAAALDPGAEFEWTLWNLSAKLTQPGALELVARAKDASGSVQPSQRDPDRLDGYVDNCYHRVRCALV
jgi:hypothetical protein